VIARAAAVLGLWLLLLASPAARAEGMTPEQETAMVAIFGDTQSANEMLRAGRTEEALALYADILARTERHFPGEGLMRASSLHNYAAALADAGRASEAERVAAEALALRETGGAATAAASTRVLLMGIRADLGIREADTRAIRAVIDVVANDPNATAEIAVPAYVAFLDQLVASGETEEAEGLAAGLAEAAPTVPPDLSADLRLAVARQRLATGRPGEAAELARQAAAGLAEDDPGRPAAVSTLARALAEDGRTGEAEALWRSAAAALEARYPKGHPDTASALDGLGLALAETGRLTEAWEVARRALDVRLAVMPEGHPAVAASFANLGLALLRDGQAGVAEQSLEKAFDLRFSAGDRPAAARTAANLATAQFLSGHVKQAIETSRRARAVLEPALPAGHPALTSALVNEAWFELAAGDPIAALDLARKARDALVAAADARRAVDADVVAARAGRRQVVVLVAAAWEAGLK
jgi:tetratricopeptide (TPR) repeat protein